MQKSSNDVRQRITTERAFLRTSLTRAGLVGLTALLAGSMAAPCPAFAGVITYSLIDLGDLPGGASRSHAYAINNHGHVVGVSDTATGDRAFLWTPAGGMQDLGDLSGGPNWSRAHDINDSGKIVGSSGAAVSASGFPQERAFIWDAVGGMQELPVGQDFGRAQGINNSGAITGRARFADVTGGHAFLRTADGTVVRLEDIPGGLDGSDAYGINQNGSVVGYGNAPRPAVNPVLHGTLWSARDQHILTDLGDFPGGAEDSRAFAINDDEDIVGYGIDEAGRTRAYIWSREGGLQDLGHIDGLPTQPIAARDVNNSRQIVGYIGNQQVGYTAFLWTPESGMVDLNTLVDQSGEGWQLGHALGINELGQIVGYGVRPGESSINDTRRAFLLTPNTVLAPWSIANNDFSSILSEWILAGPGLTEIVNRHDNPFAVLTAGSPASLYQKVVTGSEPMQLNFDLFSQQASGTMSLYFGDDLLGTWSGADYLDGWLSASYAFTDASLFNRHDFLRFTWDGESGSQVWLDNIEFTSLNSPAVPEPSSLALFSIAALCGAFGYRRRSRQ